MKNIKESKKIVQDSTEIVNQIRLHLQLSGRNPQIINEVFAVFAAPR